MSTSGVDFTVARIAALLQQLQGNPLTDGQLVTVFDVVPRAIQDSQCPAIVILPGPATYDTVSLSKAIVKEDRTYFVDYLFYRADAQTAGESQTTIEPIFSVIRNFLLARPGLYDTQIAQPEDVVFDSTLQGDEGYVIIPFAGEKYQGVRFRLQVTETARVSFVD